MFPLPNVHARLAILDIHTRQWAQPPSQAFKAELAKKCVGYCGADLKVHFLRFARAWVSKTAWTTYDHSSDADCP